MKNLNTLHNNQHAKRKTPGNDYCLTKPNLISLASVFSRKHEDVRIFHSSLISMMSKQVSPNIVGGWGEIIYAVSPQSGDRFRFRFVFLSCERAGEAKLRRPERAVFPNAGSENGEICSGGGSGTHLFLLVFAFMCMFCCSFIKSFCCFFVFFMLCAWFS